MASLEKRGNRFRVVFRLGDRKHCVGLKMSSVREAEACRSRIEENLRLVERGRLQLPSGADVGLFLLSDGKLERKPDLTPPSTIRDLIACYRDKFTTGVKEANTTKTERIHLNHLERIIGSKTPVSQVCTATIQEYVDTRKTEKYRGKTINPVTVKKEIATLKFVWNWGHRNGHVSAPYPAVGIVFPKRTHKEQFRTYDQIQAIVDRGGLSKLQIRELWDGLFLSPSEVAEVLEHVRSQQVASWFHPFLTVTAHTGARRSELFRAQVKDFDFKNRLLQIREKKKSQESETFRMVDMTVALERVMREYFANSHPGGLFAFSSVAKEPISDQESRTAFRQAVKNSKWQVLRGYHTFRHSFASNLAAGRVDHRIIDELMGHQTAEMQQRYRHLFPENRRAALVSVYGESS
jgi:integrase